MLLIAIQQGVQETAAILQPCLTPTSIGLDTEFGCFQEKGLFSLPSNTHTKRKALYLCRLNIENVQA